MITETIHRVLTDHGKLNVAVADLADDADLYAAGLTSHATVTVMLALEDALEIEFPERLLQRRTFESVAALRGAIDSLYVAG